MQTNPSTHHPANITKLTSSPEYWVFKRRTMYCPPFSDVGRVPLWFPTAPPIHRYEIPLPRRCVSLRRLKFLLYFFHPGSWHLNILSVGCGVRLGLFHIFVFGLGAPVPVRITILILTPTLILINHISVQLQSQFPSHGRELWIQLHYAPGRYGHVVEWNIPLGVPAVLQPDAELQDEPAKLIGLIFFIHLLQGY